MKWYNSNKTDMTEFKQSIFLLFYNALIDMLLSESPMKLIGNSVTSAMVFNKLLEHISEGVDLDGNIYLSIDDLLDTATGDFEVACNNNDIKNHLQYMKSCIWNAMLVGNIGVHARIGYEYFGKAGML